MSDHEMKAVIEKNQGGEASRAGVPDDVYWAISHILMDAVQEGRQDDGPSPAYLAQRDTPKIFEALSPTEQPEPVACAIYVPMPLDACGHGPADPVHTQRVEHQVWNAATNETICTARDEATARQIAALYAQPSKQTGGGGEREADLVRVLRNIAEGNLGDMPGQANYATIKQVARNAIASTNEVA